MSILTDLMLKDLKLMRDNFGDVPKLREIFGQRIINEKGRPAGVCAICKFFDHGFAFEPNTMIKSFPTIFHNDAGGVSIGFPVEGLYEYATSSFEEFWSHPNRLKFIEHCISYMEAL